MLVLLGLAGPSRLVRGDRTWRTWQPRWPCWRGGTLRTSLRHVDRTAYREAVAGSAGVSPVRRCCGMSANVMTVLGVLLGVTICVRDHHVAWPGNAASTVQRHVFSAISDGTKS